jgi:hypothetical protein
VGIFRLLPTASKPRPTSLRCGGIRTTGSVQCNLFHQPAGTHAAGRQGKDLATVCYLAAPEGYLAIDVILSSDFLWNRSEGLEVEAPIQHGTVADVVDQLVTLGFQMNESRILRGLYKSRTDLVFTNCTRVPPITVATAEGVD